MARLLIVHHTPSPACHTMLDSIREGTAADGIAGVEVLLRPALTATATDVLEADGYLLGTPANLGYMSGALKHFFDQIYYPCLDATGARPYGLFVHGQSDTDGAVAAVEKVATGLRWQPAQAPVRVIGEPDAGAREACWELGAAVAAGLMPTT